MERGIRGVGGTTFHCTTTNKFLIEMFIIGRSIELIYKARDDPRYASIWNIVKIQPQVLCYYD